MDVLPFNPLGKVEIYLTPSRYAMLTRGFCLAPDGPPWDVIACEFPNRNLPAWYTQSRWQSLDDARRMLGVLELDFEVYDDTLELP
jgi:hypothetical protein